MSTTIVRRGDRGVAARRLQDAINDRDRLEQRIAVDGIYGDESYDAEIETARLMGVHPYTGGITAARRRQAVIQGARRTAAELARAKTRMRAEKKRRKGNGKPKIIVLQIPLTNLFGSIGTIWRWTGHYTAGPRDTSDAHAQALCRQYAAQHRAQGWGTSGYHYNVTSAGTIIVLRPIAWKGAHVAANNTGNAGIMVHGQPGQRMTAAQRASLRWLLNNAHTTAMPSRGRAAKNLSTVKGSVHKDWMATSCPGDFVTDYRSAA